MAKGSKESATGAAKGGVRQLKELSIVQLRKGIKALEEADDYGKSEGLKALDVDTAINHVKGMIAGKVYTAAVFLEAAGWVAAAEEAGASTEGTDASTDEAPKRGRKAKAAPEEGAVEGEKRPRSRLDGTRVIRVKTEGNPKRVGSAAHTAFALYKDGMTVEKFIEKGGRAVDIKHDVEHNFIVLE